MVRLVTSRVHRCYSRNGGQRSARNERLTDIVHVLSCMFLLVNRNASLFLGNDPWDIAVTCGSLGSVFSITTNLSDLHATITAHRMFYKWPKRTKDGSNTFLSTATKVDAGVSLLYLLGGLALAAFTTPMSKNLQPLSVLFAGAGGSFTNTLAAVFTLVASIPSLRFKVPAPMARAQNIVVTLFLLGSLTRLYAVLTTMVFRGTPYEAPPAMKWFLLAAEMLILSGSVVNLCRVMSLLTKVQYWMSDDVKDDSQKPQRGLLSWFKSSRSSTEMSDYDSELEDQDADSDYEGGSRSHAQNSSRRSGWSKM